MPHFSVEKYQSVLEEIRKRLFSAYVLSKQNNVVFIESTALQIRKILELMSYLSMLVNSGKLNHKEKNDWHAQRIIESLASKTTIFYPLPARVIPPDREVDQPILVPLGTKHSLSQAEFGNAYSDCGKVLHAQHPFKDELDYRSYFDKNKQILDKIRNLLQNHVIAVRHDSNKYTFLCVEFDFTHNANTGPTVVRQYKTHIYDEGRLKNLFEKLWG